MTFFVAFKIEHHTPPGYLCSWTGESMKSYSTTHAENKARLARIEGQVRAVGRMVDDGEYCIDIITQIQAARSALQSVSKLIFEKHLKHCVADALEKNNEAEIDQKLEEIMAVIKRMGK
jgi:DNA-binding FrmR family transcriptional regulator